MKSKFIIFILILIIFSVSCTNQNKPLNAVNQNSEEVTPPAETLSRDTIMKNHISSFLTKGYSKDYVINSIESDIIEQNAENDKIDAIIYTKMNICNPVKNPDTVPHIKTAKEKAYNEKNPDRKFILQQEYMTLYSEYLKPFDSNFSFKLTAELIGDKINEASIQLLIAIEGDQVVKYEPAEQILPQ